MPDLDDDNPTPDFDDLIAEAQQLRGEGKDDEAIAKYEEAREVDSTPPKLYELMELYIKTKRFSSAINLSTDLYFGALKRYLDSDIPDLAEAAKTLQKISTLLIINPSETIDSPGRPLWFLSLCAAILDQHDPDHLYKISTTAENSKKIATGLYGWSEFHAECYSKYISASEENLEEILATLREWAQKNPAAWFYVGELEIRQEGTWFDKVIDAYEQVPEGDPNYVRSMLQAAYYRECWADSEESLGEPAFAAEIRSPVEECYANALKAVPLNQEVRLGYLYRHFERLLEEAAENGFDRDRVDQALKFIKKMCSALKGRVIEKVEGHNLASPHPEMYDRYMAEHAQRIMNQIEQKSQEVLTEIRAGREDVQNLQEQLEASTAASTEMIHKYVVERLQAYQKQIEDCERRLNEDHRDFWEQLTPEARCYLATGDYIREKSPAGMECSGEAIEYAKALETELRQHLVGRFISFAQERERGPNIFEREPSKVTLGSFLNVLEKSGLKSEFVERLGENGVFLSRDFHIPKKIKKLRDAAAHGGNIGRQQATELRDLVLKILPKIVALRSR